ncbi:MAG: PKD domain-containing protein [Chitinivibrionales bacterium]|nr:PKD domain-containing protein [Chitinivibrionales bacterium]
MKRRMITGVALLVCVLMSRTDAQTAIYHIGNSMTDLTYGVHQIANSKGCETVFGRHMIPGAPLSWLWGHPTDGVHEPSSCSNSHDCLSDNAWDVVVLQPWLRGLESDIESATNFINEARQGNPDVTVIIYAVGPRQADGIEDYDQLFEDSDASYRTGRAFYEALTTALRQAFPNNAIGLSPCAHIFNKVNHMLLNGQSIPAMSAFCDLWADCADDVHYSELGKYISATALYSVIFQGDPHNSAISGLRSANSTYSVPQGFAEVIWDLSVEVLGEEQQYCRIPALAQCDGYIPPPDSGNDTSTVENTPPDARITADVLSGPAPLTVHFDGSASTDPDSGDGVFGFGWSFGDGTTEGSVIEVTHTFTQPGEHEVIMMAEDYHGAKDYDTLAITVTETTHVSTPATKCRDLVAAGNEGSVRLYDLAGRPIALHGTAKRSSGVLLTVSEKSGVRVHLGGP